MTLIKGVSPINNLHMISKNMIYTLHFKNMFYLSFFFKLIKIVFVMNYFLSAKL